MVTSALVSHNDFFQDKMYVLGLLASCVAVSYAARVSVQIPSSQALPNPATLPASTHAVLTGPPGVRHDVELRRDSSFQFQNVDPASYLLTIHAHDFVFPPLRIDVTSPEAGADGESITAWQTFKGNEWSNRGPQYGVGRGELVLQVQPQGQRDFYQVRGGFNLLGFLKSPMILMALGSAVLIFGMPYLMDNSE